MENLKNIYLGNKELKDIKNDRTFLTAAFHRLDEGLRSDKNERDSEQL